MNNLGTYQDFLDAFEEKGYRFISFAALSCPEGQAILRHDVDFDPGFALEMAQLEARKGIRATYFFLLRSSFYNILSPEHYGNVCRIHDLGHDISLHFDPLLYEDFHQGLEQEMTFFAKCFGGHASIISLHRPNDFFLHYDAPIHGVEHTYQSKYFHDIKFFSDSTGAWRYGPPCDSAEFLDRKTLHLLLHPIWWMIEGHSNTEKLRVYFQRRVQQLKDEFSHHCLPFREIYANV